MRKPMEETVAFLALIKPRLSELTSNADQNQRQLGAAGLARCVALLEGIVALDEAGLEEDAGVLMRSLTEAWAVSLYLVLGPDGAVFDLAHDASEALRKMRNDFEDLAPLPASLKASFDRMIDSLADLAKLSSKKTKAGNPQKVVYADLMQRDLTAILERENPNNKEMAQQAFAHVYRVESTFSTHAGLLSIKPYLNDSKEPWSVQRPPDRPYLEGNAEKAGAWLTAYLAAAVFEKFGHDPKPFVEAFAAIEQAG